LTGAGAGLRRELLLRLSLLEASKQPPFFLTLSSASIRTLYIRHVPDELAAGLEKLAAQAGLPRESPIQRDSLMRFLHNCGVCYALPT